MTFTSFKNKISAHKECLLLALIMIVAGLTRIIKLGTLPDGIHQDEAFVALNAYDLLMEGRDSGGFTWPVYGSTWGDGQSIMYTWLLLPLMAITKNYTSLWVIRIPQCLVALLSILAVHGLVKRLFNDYKKGLLAAALLAICPWHIMMSRWGLDANLAPGFLIIATYFYVRSLEKNSFLIPAALFYGLTLYCYAVTWPIIPLVLLAELAYGFCVKKYRVNRYLIISGVIVVVLALPLVLFVLVNQELISPIYLPFMTVYKALGYRGAEVSLSPATIWQNIKTLGRLLIINDTGLSWNVIEPYGLFYRIGLVFIFAGGVFLIANLIKKIRKHEKIQGEIILLIQLLAGLILAGIVQPKFHQTNILFIPLVMLEAYGIWNCLTLLKGKIRICLASMVGLIYAVLFVLFTKDYFGDYVSLVNSYFGQGIEESVKYALTACEEKDIHKITAEQATQWPRLLLYTATTPSEYFSENLVYDKTTTNAPWSYKKGDLTIQTRIDDSDISKDSIYIIYYTDYDIFADDFNMTQFNDWYVCVPRE